MPRGRKPNPDPPVSIQISVPRSLANQINQHFEDRFVAMLSRDGKVRKYGALSKVVCKLLREYLNNGSYPDKNVGLEEPVNKEV